MVHLFSSSELTQLCHRNIDWWQFGKLKSFLEGMSFSAGAQWAELEEALYLFIYLFITVYGQRPKDNL